MDYSSGENGGENTDRGGEIDVEVQRCKGRGKGRSADETGATDDDVESDQ